MYGLSWLGIKFDVSSEASSDCDMVGVVQVRFKLGKSLPSTEE
jgi:hypothetical protein